LNIIEILLPISILLAGSFALAFILAVRSGQYDDVETPPHRILFEAPKSQNESDVTGEPS
jgi:cbb3-type cytochrome oxidase maturation protein